MSKQANERRMRALVARWRDEGGSGASFARRSGISATKFGYWCRLVTREQRKPAARPMGFAPVRLVGPALGSTPLEIAFVSGERVLVREGASAETLAAVVAALRARC
jgi:hypothetical protein